MNESGVEVQQTLAAAGQKMMDLALPRRQFSAQEDAWIVRATTTPAGKSEPMKLKIDDKTIAQDKPFLFTASGADAAKLPAIKNLGDRPVHVAMTLSRALRLHRWRAEGPSRIRGPAVVLRYQRQGYRSGHNASGRPVGRRADRALYRPGRGPAGAVRSLAGRLDGRGGEHRRSGKPLSLAEGPDRRRQRDRRATGSISRRPASGDGDRHEFRFAYVVRAAAVLRPVRQPGALSRIWLQPALSARRARERQGPRSSRPRNP